MNIFPYSVSLSDARKKSWLIIARSLGVLLAILEFWLILTRLDIHYAVNDDVGILRHFMGYYTDQVSTFHVFLHPAICLLLNFLRTLNGMIPWFSWFQVGLLFISCASAAGSLCVLLYRSGKRLWMSAILSGIFLWTYTLIPSTWITFTQTGAMLGMASVLRFLSISDEPFSRRCGMSATVALLCIALMMRSTAALPSLIFIIIICIPRFCLHAEQRKSLILFVCCMTACVASLIAWQQFQPKTTDAENYIKWQNARYSTMDYHDLSEISQEITNQLEISDESIDLLERWCFLDEKIDTETMDAIGKAMDAGTSRNMIDRCRNASMLLSQTWESNIGLHLPTITTGVLLLVETLLLLLCRKGKQKILACIPLGTMIISIAMLMGLAIWGRIPARAAQTVLLITGGLGFALLFLLGKRQFIIIAVVIVAVCFYQTKLQLPMLLYDEDQAYETEDAWSALDEYALYDENMLFIYDDSLMTDLRMFPDVREGIPQNITPWGGWSFKSPENVRQLEAFELNPYHFDPTAFLRDDVCLVTGVIDPPPDMFAQWLRFTLGCDIDYDLYGEYNGIYCWQFYCDD